MTDYHTHVLPCIDDGAKSIEESLQMLYESHKQGVDLCVATPHCTVHNNDDIGNFIAKRNASKKILTDAIKSEQKPCPKLLFGAEVNLDNDISRYPDINKLCIGDTNYMLIELDINYENKYDEWLYCLFQKEIKPIIAHIDRYFNWKSIVSALSDLDVIYQLNATSFFGFGGKKFIHEFMQYQKPVIIGSDMHGSKYRPTKMEKAYKKAKKILGNSAEELFNNTLICL